MTARWTALSLVVVLACAPGQIERIDYLGPDGLLRRVELPRASTTRETAARLGQPDVIRSGPGQVVYWLYAFDHMRHDYLLTFRGDRLAHVRYLPRTGAGP